MSEAVVDSHIHFWDPDRLHYDWLSGDLRRAFRPDDLSVGSVPVEALVFVEADRHPCEVLAEVDWVVSLSSPGRPIRSVVAAVALELTTATAELAALARRPEVSGVRRLLQDSVPGFCAKPEFVRGVQSLGQWGLTFDLCVRDRQLAEAATLAERCPDVTFVLDHLGKPRVGNRPERTWETDIERLAALPNTRCKLSGLTSEVVDATVRRPALFRPYLEHALQMFGPHRCLFGSDWPVSSLTVSYEGWFDHVMDALTGYSSGEAAQVLGGTARAVYRIEPVASGDGESGDVAKVPTMHDRMGASERTWR